MERVNNIYYLKNIPDSSKPTVVFLHGLSSNHTTWNTTAEILIEHGYNIISVDIRGHGFSDKVRKRNLYRFLVFKNDLRAIIEKENLNKVILVGYSFGGTIALDYVSEYPNEVLGLVVVSTNHRSPFYYSKLRLFTHLIAGLVNIGGWLMLWQKRQHYYYFDQAISTGYWESTFRGFITMPISINLWMLSEVMNIDFSKTIDQITCPTLILRGSHDPYFSLKEAEDIKAKIKSAEIITLNDSGHYLASDYQARTTETILNFLTEQNFK
jgi:non-heme chloroperoxidase